MSKGSKVHTVLQDPGYVKGVKSAYCFARSRVCQRGQKCILHAASVARLYKISYVKGVERNKKIAIIQQI